MTIAINLTSFVSGGNKNSVCTQFERLAESRPNDRFIFILTKGRELNIDSRANIFVIHSKVIGNTILSWKLWYDYTLPKILKKYQVSFLVNTDNVCSLRTTIPQCLFLMDVGFTRADQSQPKKAHRYLQKNFTAFSAKAAAVFASTHCLVQEVSRHYPGIQQKWVNVPIVINPVYKPADWEEKEAIKEKYSDGKEFFLFIGEFDERANLINLLKAFTHFKRRQKSNMQLLVTISSIAQNEIIETLKTYKYRNEVKTLFDLPASEVARITAAAYAFVYPVLQDDFPLLPLQAIFCETPLILSDTTIFHEVAAGAAVYVDPGNISSIAENMMLLFKDESQRNKLIHEARGIIAKRKQTDSMDVLWKTITNSA